MTDVFEQDRQRILGITRGAEVAQRVQTDLAIRAAIAIEQEQRAAAQQAAQARAAEAQAIAQAEGAAVDRLSSLKPLYQQRQEAARQAIESIAALWRIENELRAGLGQADRTLGGVEMLIDSSARSSWRVSLRDRAGLPANHIYAPDVQPTSEGQAVGVTVARAITAGVIQPGAITAGRDVVNL